MRKNLFLFICYLVIFPLAGSQPAYQDATLPVEDRVDDLVKRMTLEEKVGQLCSFFSMDSLAFDQDGYFISNRDTAIINRGLGSFRSFAIFLKPSVQERIRCMNGIQKYMVEKTRLGIPVLFFGESLHGLMVRGATSFPQAIALGSSWDTTLVEEIFTVAAREARANGIRQVLSPVVDLALDPRWGRTEECYGEDPYLVSRLAMAAVFGFQGRGETINKEHVVVTLKHFAGHGQAEGGRNIAPVNYSERYFRETHLYPFEIAVKRAHAWSIMASYNEWDGIPNHVNHHLLTAILRGEWGFKGFVMSDGGGLDVTYRDHLAAADSAESGILSIKAGIDFDLGSRKRCFFALIDQAKQGRIEEDVIDRAVKNVLRVKFTCGLFEYPYIDVDLSEKITNCSEHKALALEAAHKAMVLLKNERNTLPFDLTKIKKIAVIGPNATGIHLGGYSATPMEGVSVLEGIKEFVGDKCKVIYAEGCKLTLNKECHWHVDENPILNDPGEDQKLIRKAIKAAKKSDAVILVLGENELINREAWSKTHLGDRDDLDLVGSQNELAREMIATGKPLVILLINGRPVTINDLDKHAPAIIECWYLGQETGRAIANVIFGKVNPSGKLPITFPRSVGQLPCFYNKKPSSQREYVLAQSTPLYPFGFGLSYTTFTYKNLQLDPRQIGAEKNAVVSVEVTNAGSMKGDEIVQLYIHDLVSLPTRPVKELKDFARIMLNPGETKTVRFTITPDKLAAFDLNMKRVVQPGEFEIMVGKSSVDVLIDTLQVD